MPSLIEPLARDRKELNANQVDERVSDIHCDKNSRVMYLSHLTKNKSKEKNDARPSVSALPHRAVRITPAEWLCLCLPHMMNSKTCPLNLKASFILYQH